MYRSRKRWGCCRESVTLCRCQYLARSSLSAEIVPTMICSWPKVIDRVEGMHGVLRVLRGRGGRVVEAFSGE